MIRISDKSMFAYFHLYIANKLPQSELTKRERRLVRELLRNDAWKKLLLKQPLRRGTTEIGSNATSLQQNPSPNF